MTAALERRARKIREREVILAWQYRQRLHGQGIWFRLRRALVQAAEVWVVSEEDADGLEAEGYDVLPVGRELEPPKRLLLVTAERVRALGARRIPVRLSADFLSARSVALVPF